MASSDYPYIVRTVDPLVVRVDELSLLVGSTNFYAKIKNGSAYKGFLVYCSGLGYHIHSEVVQNVGTQTINGQVINVEDKTESDLISYAKAWLDELEDCFSDIVEDTSIKAAIDRLNWQLHYDITKTSADKPIGMADVDIDVTADTVNDYNIQANNSITSIALSLKADGEYTISKALRDVSTNDVSVSNRIALQQAALSSGMSTINTTLSNIKSNTDTLVTSNGIISTASQTLVSNSAASTNYLSNISSKATSIDTSLDNIESDTNDLKTKIDNTYVTISSGGNDINAIRTYGSTNGW